MQKIVLISLLALVIASCDSNTSIVQHAYTELSTTSVESNSKNQYIYCQPKEFQPGLPVIICLDANGDGKLAVERVKKSIRHEKVLLIGSNSIQNGSPNYDQLITELLTEAAKKYEVDSKKAFLVGFSGGARMAHLYASSFPIKGVVMFGAGPGSVIPSTKTYVSCGIKDFNFMETYMRPSIGLFDQNDYIVDYHVQGHEWPDSTAISDAMLFHFPNEYVLERRKSTLLNESNKLALSGQGLFAYKCLEKAYKYELDKDEKRKIRASCKDLLENTLVKKDLAALENYLRLEIHFRETYVDKLSNSTLAYWRDEIDGLREKALYSSNTRDIQHAERLLGYMGIMFYSRLKVLIFSGGKEQTTMLVNAFQYLEPENPDMFYFKALLFSKNGQMDSAGHFIALARKYGLKE